MPTGDVVDALCCIESGFGSLCKRGLVRLFLVTLGLVSGGLTLSLRVPSSDLGVGSAISDSSSSASASSSSFSSSHGLYFKLGSKAVTPSHYNAFPIPIERSQHPLSKETAHTPPW